MPLSSFQILSLIAAELLFDTICSRRAWQFPTLEGSLDLFCCHSYFDASYHCCMDVPSYLCPKIKDTCQRHLESVPEKNSPAWLRRARGTIHYVRSTPEQLASLSTKHWKFRSSRRGQQRAPFRACINFKTISMLSFDLCTWHDVPLCGHETYRENNHIDRLGCAINWHHQKAIYRFPARPRLFLTQIAQCPP